MLFKYHSLQNYKIRGFNFLIFQDSPTFRKLLTLSQQISLASLSLKSDVMYSSSHKVFGICPPTQNANDPIMKFSGRPWTCGPFFSLRKDSPPTGIAEGDSELPSFWFKEGYGKEIYNSFNYVLHHLWTGMVPSKFQPKQQFWEEPLW